MKYILLGLLLIGCGPDHVQNVDITPNERGGAPQNTFVMDRCLNGQKVSCEYSYAAQSNGDVLITYGYRVCFNNTWGNCLKN